MRKSCIEIKGCGRKMYDQNVTCKHCDPAGKCAHQDYQEEPMTTNCTIDLPKEDQILIIDSLVRPKDKNVQLADAMDRLKDLVAEEDDEDLLSRCYDAIIWMSGSSDFAQHGIAHAGFEKSVKPLIDELMERLAVYPPKEHDDDDDEGPSVIDIVKDYLEANGYDGLIADDGCGCDGSAPCVDGPYHYCRAAFAGPGGTDIDGQNCDVLYYATKSSVKEAQRIKEDSCSKRQVTSPFLDPADLTFRKGVRTRYAKIMGSGCKKDYESRRRSSGKQAQRIKEDAKEEEDV